MKGYRIAAALLIVAAAGCSAERADDAETGNVTGTAMERAADAITESLPADSPSLADIVAGAHRTPEFAARDEYRNPLPVLEFFEVEPDMTVVEIWPGAGWWTEILAPYLRDQGTYYAASFSAQSRNASAYLQNAHEGLMAKLQATPELYDRVIVTELGPADAWQPAPPASADRVLAFRNVHSWMRGGTEQEVFEAVARTLKPGGIFGLVQHRGDEGTSPERSKETGYVDPAHVIALAEAAGLELAGESEINANPRDTRDHPAGVWTLPPSLRGCADMDDAAERSECEDHYRAIGESDRMTLIFRKP